MLKRHARSPSPLLAGTVLDRLEVRCAGSGVLPRIDLLGDGLGAPFPGHADRAVAILFEDEETLSVVRGRIEKRLQEGGPPRWTVRAGFLLEEIERRGR